MKSACFFVWNIGENVAPFAGAWIEIEIGEDYEYNLMVAPFAGAWIEIAVGEIC